MSVVPGTALDSSDKRLDKRLDKRAALHYSARSRSRMLGYKSIFSFWMTSCFWDLVASRPVKTKVAILGGGMAGIIAARTLQEHAVEDFVIVEAREELGAFMNNLRPSILTLLRGKVGVCRMLPWETG